MAESRVYARAGLRPGPLSRGSSHYQPGLSQAPAMQQVALDVWKVLLRPCRAKHGDPGTHPYPAPVPNRISGGHSPLLSRLSSDSAAVFLKQLLSLV